MKGALAVVVTVWAVGANAACRQALALGLDVSGSVDAREYRLQVDGVARALLDPAVEAAFLALPDAPVRLYVFEWAGQGTQRVIVPWTEITGSSDLQGVAASLMAHRRRAGDPATAIGEALQFGAEALAEEAGCWRLTLDLSGDGPSNTGPRPRAVRASPGLARVTVNGLVIGADAPALGDMRQAEIGEIWAYYLENVIRGPDAFIEVALGFEAFEAAMTRKLLRELEPGALSAVPTPQAPDIAGLE